MESKMQARMQEYAVEFRKVFAHFSRPDMKINIGFCNLYDKKMAVYFWVVSESEYESKVKIRNAPPLGMPKMCALVKMRALKTSDEKIRVYDGDILYIVKWIHKYHWSKVTGHLDAREELGILFCCLPENGSNSMSGNKCIEALNEYETKNKKEEEERLFELQLCEEELIDHSLGLKTVNEMEKDVIFQSYNSWAMQDDMRGEFRRGVGQDRIISKIKGELLSDEAIHIRICGATGIGKTRVVLEAVKSYGKEGLVAYCEYPWLSKTNFWMEILTAPIDTQLIVVIDNCPKEYHCLLFKLNEMCPTTKTISIHSECDTIDDTIHFEAQPLDSQQVAQIIRGYVSPGKELNELVSLCSGSPRIAHTVGRNLANNPHDLLKSLDTVDVWTRYVAGCYDPHCIGVQYRRTVLRLLALFKQVNLIDITNEAFMRKITEADPLIDRARFLEIINSLRRAKILQGETTLSIIPKLLHIRLWDEFWKTHGNSFDYSEFTKGLPESMINSFCEMLDYISVSEIESIASMGKYRRLQNDTSANMD